MRYKKANKKTFDDVVTLVKYKNRKVDEYGNEIIDKRYKEIFCNVNSIGRDSFYSAGNKGLSLAYEITINNFEYEGEEKVIYNNKEFDVIRTYLVDDFLLEITVGDKS